MSLNFPNDPTLNQTYSYGERTWKWNGTYWETANYTIGYTGSQGIPGSGIIDAAIVGDDLVFTYDDSTQQNVGRVVGYTGSGGSGGGGGGAGVANLYQSGDLIVFTGTQRWYAPFNLQFSEIIGRVVENANDDIEIEIKKNGNLLTGLTIPVGLYSASTSGDDSVILTMNEGDYLTVDVVQVGTVVQPGSDLYIQFKYVNI